MASDSSVRSAVQMEPLALYNQFVLIRTYQSEKYYKVNFLERIPFFQVVDIGALAANTQSNRTALGNLDLWDYEFGQWRFYPLDPVQVRLYLPNGVSKWQLKNITTGIDKSIIYRDPELASTEFCSWEDQRPSVECLNFSDYALLGCRIMVCGIRYHVKDISNDDNNKLKAGGAYTMIQCAGMGGGGD